MKKKLIIFGLLVVALLCVPLAVVAGDFECDDIEIVYAELYIYLWNPFDGWVRVSLGWWPAGSICHDDDWKNLPLPKNGGQ